MITKLYLKACEQKKNIKFQSTWYIGKTGKLRRNFNTPDTSLIHGSQLIEILKKKAKK